MHRSRGIGPRPGWPEFLRWRDLTCRWPGCDRPVANCDIDHTVPYPGGSTHASGLKHYCRIHHLLKTFYGGPGGWRDQQLPDGTVVFTAPTGHTYTTQAHGGMLFPTLAQSTGELAVPKLAEPSPYRDVMMPKRKQTRNQNRQHRITPRTPPENRTHRRRRTTTPSLARRQLPTATVLMSRIPWRQAWSPGRHVASVLLILLAVRSHQGRLLVPVDE